MARYWGNKHKMEVHDTQNEKTNCQLSEITGEHRVDFDSLPQARAAGFDPCAYCLPDEISEH